MPFGNKVGLEQVGASPKVELCAVQMGHAPDRIGERQPEVPCRLLGFFTLEKRGAERHARIEVGAVERDLPAFVCSDESFEDRQQLTRGQIEHGPSRWARLLAPLPAAQVAKTS